ncbi:MAG: carboxypeptidase-like regulatory domain-containing protein [Proteobacteria bacterium]|nr:carboxypeptidase-like regulatory domain-containing protein [Pseudomonadota bacterium]
MDDLHPCPSCRRHVGGEAACPFCGGALSPVPSRTIAHGRFSRAAVFAGATTLAGCWTAPEPTHAQPPDPHSTETHEAKVDPQDTTPPSTTTGQVEGVVTDDAGQVVAGIEVWLQGGNGQQATQTDQRGHYLFRDVPPGPIEILVRTSNNPRHSPFRASATIVVGQTQRANVAVSYPRSNPSNIPMPYGAPPARRRVV